MISLDNLVLETTRKCNMKCAHCLRGEAQNKSMSDEHMYNFLRQVSYIATVTFTGGEPTLPSGMKVIERFMEICNELGVDVGNFYFATNAKVWRGKLPELINRLYNFCSDNEVSNVDISGDQYHCAELNAIDNHDFKCRLEDELLYTYGLENMVGIKPNIDPNFVITEGRGYYIGGRGNNLETVLYEYWDDDQLQVREGTIYLNCDGKVISGCDWSYETQNEREDILICLADEDLEQAIIDYGEGEEE